MKKLTSGMLRHAISAALLVAIGASAVAQPKIAPKYKASAIEVAQLPKYCWAQYVDQAYAGHPQFSIPNVCGPYVNHFCPGLVGLMQASSATHSMSGRREILRIAAENIQYTLRYKGIQPPCPIYRDVKAAEARANSMRMFVK